MEMTVRYWFETRLPQYWFPIIYWTTVLFLADRLPWFARRVIINLLVGREILTTFVMTDQLRKPMLDRELFICMKW
jgi:hypothetical protein